MKDFAKIYIKVKKISKDPHQLTSYQGETRKIHTNTHIFEYLNIDNNSSLQRIGYRPMAHSPTATKRINMPSTAAAVTDTKFHSEATTKWLKILTTQILEIS